LINIKSWFKSWLNLGSVLIKPVLSVGDFLPVLKPVFFSINQLVKDDDTSRYHGKMRRQKE